MALCLNVAPSRLGGFACTTSFFVLTRRRKAAKKEHQLRALRPVTEISAVAALILVIAELAGDAGDEGAVEVVQLAQGVRQRKLQSVQIAAADHEAGCRGTQLSQLVLNRAGELLSFRKGAAPAPVQAYVVIEQGDDVLAAFRAQLEQGANPLPLRLRYEDEGPGFVVVHPDHAACGRPAAEARGPENTVTVNAPVPGTEGKSTDGEFSVLLPTCRQCEVNNKGEGVLGTNVARGLRIQSDRPKGTLRQFEAGHGSRRPPACVSIVATLILFAACSQTPSSGARDVSPLQRGNDMSRVGKRELRDSEIKELLVGRTLIIREVSGRPVVASYSEHYQQDGSAIVQYDRVMRQARYSLRLGLLCLTLNGEGTKCRKLYVDREHNLYYAIVGDPEDTMVAIEIK